MTAPGSAPMSGTAAAEAVLAAAFKVIEATIPGYHSDSEAIVRALAAAGLLADPDATEAAAAQARREALLDAAEAATGSEWPPGFDFAARFFVAKWLRARAVRDTAEPEETP